MNRKKFLVYSCGFLILGSVLAGAFYYLHFNAQPIEFKIESPIAEADAEQLSSESHDEKDKKEESSVNLTEDQVKKMGLEIRSAEPKVIAVTLARRGQIVLHPDGAVHVLNKAVGVAKETKKNLGDYVRTGDILAVLESQEMADAKASYLASRNKEHFANTDLERETRLYNKKISSAQDYLKALAAFKDAQINTELENQKLKVLGLNEQDISRLNEGNGGDLRIFEVRAPMDGVITSRHITKGELIEDKTVIYEIADLSTVWVEMGIYPQDLALVKEGQLVNVQSPFDVHSSEAQVFYLSPLIENENMLTKAVAELHNPHWKWKPGMFVNVDIAAANVPVEKAIAKEAIQSIEGRDCVFVQGPKGFEKRFVRLGKRDGQFVEILEGLDEQDQCVVNHAILLKAEMGKSAIQDDD